MRSDEFKPPHASNANHFQPPKLTEHTNRAVLVIWKNLHLYWLTDVYSPQSENLFIAKNTNNGVTRITQEKTVNKHTIKVIQIRTGCIFFFKNHTWFKVSFRNSEVKLSAHSKAGKEVCSAQRSLPTELQEEPRQCSPGLLYMYFQTTLDAMANTYC